ncbi:hypothetical protein HDU80_006381 [Chytriomyces hyalinus]|nr:hypothetical protein HDU80_006381 [Chytriomyces hyalinus]
MESIAAEVEYWRQMRITNGETPTPSLQRKAKSAVDFSFTPDTCYTESRRRFECQSADFTLERQQYETPTTNMECEAHHLYTPHFVDTFSGVVNIPSGVASDEDDGGDDGDTLRDHGSTTHYIRSTPSDPGIGHHDQLRMDLNHLYHCHNLPKSKLPEPGAVSLSHVQRTEAEHRRNLRKSASCSRLQSAPTRLHLLARDTPANAAIRKKSSFWARAKGTWNKMFDPFKSANQTPSSLRSNASKSSFVASAPAPKSFFGSLLRIERLERVDSSEYNSMMAQPVPEGEKHW